MSNYTQHIVGPVRGNVQRCVRCYIRIRDNSDAFVKLWFEPGTFVYVNEAGFTSVPAVGVTLNACAPRAGSVTKDGVPVTGS